LESAEGVVLTVVAQEDYGYQAIEINNEHSVGPEQVIRIWDDSLQSLLPKDRRLSTKKEAPATTSRKHAILTLPSLHELVLWAADYGPLLDQNLLYRVDVVGILQQTESRRRKTPWAWDDVVTGCDPLNKRYDGQVVVIRRGECSFGAKSLNVQLAGAVGMIVVSTSSIPVTMTNPDKDAPGFVDGIDIIQGAGFFADQESSVGLMMSLWAHKGHLTATIQLLDNDLLLEKEHADFRLLFNKKPILNLEIMQRRKKRHAVKPVKSVVQTFRKIGWNVKSLLETGSNLSCLAKSARGSVARCCARAS
jgi:PA domain